MRKIIGIGETILDIIFRNGQPSRAVPGGSTFNTMVSLGRLKQNVCFLSETGNDYVGDTICRFMEENHLPTDYMSRFSQGKSPVSLAFLDDRGDARYLFYGEYPEKRLDVTYPRIDEDDILILGSYFSIDPRVRERIADLLEYARTRKAIVYYDPNFRKAHAHEAIRLAPSVIENLEFADIVRGSAEDFETLYGESDPHKIYKNRIAFYCPRFIFTSGAAGVELFAPGLQRHFDVKQAQVVSTIGAGDNFNAGILFGLLREEIGRNQLLEGLTPETWGKLIGYGLDFAAHVCGSYDNYISDAFAAQYR